MNLILVILLVLLLCGGGYGYHSGVFNSSAGFAHGGSVIGLLLTVLIIMLVLRLLGVF